VEGLFNWLATAFGQVMSFITQEKFWVFAAIILAYFIANLIIGRGRLKSVGSVIGFLVGFSLLYWGAMIYMENAPKRRWL